jgi:hypothetical protein
LEHRIDELDDAHDIDKEKQESQGNSSGQQEEEEYQP